ncbi:hypothetical protein H6G17_30780 [Chroococcidiopsis sp. FACHB-1243]|uniref:hypothetical protein n=1 Tax=Chroococcidiopsis sp. [FACHB-1243] TaxID=2692781 RepID=UPI00177E039E|nr:hypothetical protein [Chroococcidiopsis sp. [FACHB-1243]]MBD2309800.1 hypothetical protein [Chroococcidiopsis sp. [FACHB-1243]]
MFYIQIINPGGKPSDFPGDKFDFQCDCTALESAQNKNSRRAKAKAIEIVRNIQQVYYLENRCCL